MFFTWFLCLSFNNAFACVCVRVCACMHACCVRVCVSFITIMHAIQESYNLVKSYHITVHLSILCLSNYLQIPSSVAFIHVEYKWLIDCVRVNNHTHNMIMHMIIHMCMHALQHVSISVTYCLHAVLNCV